MTKKKTTKTKKQHEKELEEKLKDIASYDEILKMVKDNAIEFPYKGENYRVRRPIFKEKDKINEERMRKKLELMKDDKYLFAEEWKEIYKKKGRDIEELDRTIEELDKDQEQIEIDMTKATDKNSKFDDKKTINKCVEQIKKIKLERQKIRYQKAEMLEYSVETTLKNHTTNYIAYLVLEKEETTEESKKWKRAFDKFDDYLNCEDDGLIILTAQYLSAVLLSYERT